MRPLLVATIKRRPQRTIDSTLPTPGTVSPRIAFQMPLGPSKTAVPLVMPRRVQPGIVAGGVSGHGVSFSSCRWGDNVFFLIWCSAVCSDAMLRAICSCFSVSSSTLRRTTARSRGIASSCRTNSGEVAAAAGAGAGATSSSRPMTTTLATGPTS